MLNCLQAMVSKHLYAFESAGCWLVDFIHCRSPSAADKAREETWDLERKQYRDELEAASRARASGEKTGNRVAQLETELRAARDAELEALTALSTGTTELKTKITSLEEELAATTKQLFVLVPWMVAGPELFSSRALFRGRKRFLTSAKTTGTKQIRSPRA